MNVIAIHGRDVQDAFTEARFAVLPLGSIEYHGPHSPLGTDTLLAQGFAERIDPALSPLVYPVIPYTACPGKTSRYPGTISVGPAVFIGYLTAVLEGICSSGIRRIVLLNAHDANMGPARTAAEAVTGVYPDAGLLLLNWWQLTDPGFAERHGLFHGTTGRGHGGPYEMSAVKAMHPEWVKVAETDVELDSCPPLSSLPHVLVEGRPQGWNGYTGRIRQTSQEAGKQIVEEAARNMNAIIGSWLSPQKSKREDEPSGL